jgi:hypothetical protein
MAHIPPFTWIEYLIQRRYPDRQAIQHPLPSANRWQAAMPFEYRERLSWLRNQVDTSDLIL